MTDNYTLYQLQNAECSDSQESRMRTKSCEWTGVWTSYSKCPYSQLHTPVLGTVKLRISLGKEKKLSLDSTGAENFSGMPLGRKTVPSSFQGQLTSCCQRQVAVCAGFLPDTFILSKSIRAHLGHVQILFGLLSRPRMSLQIKKWFFLKDWIDYFG